jgi:thiosulfate dehydrogenase [quinone] large subunit
MVTRVHASDELTVIHPSATSGTADVAPVVTPAPAGVGHAAGIIALTGLRLAIGFEFVWAFFDKMFGFGYATPSARAWINGGSPTKGFLNGVDAGPLKGFFHSIAGTPIADPLFMFGLLGIGTALILGVALRPAAASGVLLLMLMWFATWPLASTAAGQPTGSVNPLVDDHIVSSIALVVIAVFAVSSAGYLGRRWQSLGLIKNRTWLH